MSELEIRTEQSQGKQSVFLQLSALAGVIGPIFFVVVFTLDGFLHPGYSAMSEPVSNLGAIEPYGWIQNANFLISGLLLITFAIGFYQQLRSISSGRWVSVSTAFLSLTGIGLATATFFHTDIPGFPPVTSQGVVHDILFFVVFISLGSAIFISGAQLRKITGWHAYGWYSIITGLVTLVLFSVLAVMADSSLGGLFQRIFEIEILAWYVVMGCRFLALDRARK